MTFNRGNSNFIKFVWLPSSRYRRTSHAFFFSGVTVRPGSEHRAPAGRVRVQQGRDPGRGGPSPGFSEAPPLPASGNPGPKAKGGKVSQTGPTEIQGPSCRELLPRAPGPWRGSRPQHPPRRSWPPSCWSQARTGLGQRPAVGLRFQATDLAKDRVLQRPNPPPRGHRAGPPPPHLTVLGVLLQGAFVQPVHRVRGGGREVGATQAAPLLHFRAMVGGAVAHSWG